MRLLHVSEEKTFSLKTAVICIFQKQAFAHHWFCTYLSNNKILIGLTAAHTHRNAFNINTKNLEVAADSCLILLNNYLLYQDRYLNKTESEGETMVPPYLLAMQ